MPANTSKIVIFYQTKYVFFLPRVLFGQEWAFWEKVWDLWLRSILIPKKTLHIVHRSRAAVTEKNSEKTYFLPESVPLLSQNNQNTNFQKKLCTLYNSRGGSSARREKNGRVELHHCCLSVYSLYHLSSTTTYLRSPDKLCTNAWSPALLLCTIILSRALLQQLYSDQKAEQLQLYGQQAFLRQLYSIHHAVLLQLHGHHMLYCNNCMSYNCIAAGTMYNKKRAAGNGFEEDGRGWVK